MRIHAARRAAAALALLAALAGSAEAQIGNIRRAVRRAAQGPPAEVQQLLARIEETRTRFDDATYLLNQSALVMEGVVATETRRAEIRRELESAGSREQRRGDNRVQLDAQDRTTRLEQATRERQYEQRQLSQAQSSNVTAASFNAALAAKLDADAASDAQRLAGEAGPAIQSIRDDPVMLPYLNRLQQAVSTHLPTIINTVPVQVRLAAAIREAAQQARSANQAVQVTEAAPAPGAAPQTIDVNAI